MSDLKQQLTQKINAAEVAIRDVLQGLADDLGREPDVFVETEKVCTYPHSPVEIYVTKVEIRLR